MNRNKTGNELTARQKKGLAALVTTPTVEKAAVVAGVTRGTLHRWMNDPAFRDELTRRRNEIVDTALDTFKSYVLKAVSTLGGLLDSDDEKVRRAASKDILAFVMHVRESEDADRTSRPEEVRPVAPPQRPM